MTWDTLVSSFVPEFLHQSAGDDADDHGGDGTALADVLRINELGNELGVS